MISFLLICGALYTQFITIGALLLSHEAEGIRKVRAGRLALIMTAATITLAFAAGRYWQ